jgi:hypothetical protein
MKKTKKEPERRIYRDYTLDEYDELTLEQQSIGAGWERGKIIAELERRHRQLLDFSRDTRLPSEDDQFRHHANGLYLAIQIINNMRSYEDNVGCPECEAF